MEFQIKGKKITNKERSYLLELGFKWCSKCKQAKEFNNFNLNSKIPDGHCAICRECANNKRKNNLEYYRQRDAERYKNNHEKLISKAAEYRASHQNSIRESKIRSYKENREIILAKQRKYRQDNLEKIKIKHKEYIEKNKVIIYNKQKEYRKNNSERINSYTRKRYKNSDVYRLGQICRGMVRRMFNVISINKNITTNEILGYSPLELKQHIEKQFKEGMNWDNYGEWHIDHIIPISSAKDLEDGIRLSRLENLQPLWAEENLTKANKINK